MSVKEILLLSLLVYGLLFNVSNGQNAKFGTSKWNQNGHKTTSEPRLGAFDRVNTTDVPEEFEPVTNVRGVIINKPVPGQEMFNNILNTANVASNRGAMNKVFSPQNLPKTRTTPEPRLGKFDRINTTDIPEEFEPVTNYNGLIINKPVHGQEMYNDIMAPGNTGVSRVENSQMSWNKIQTQHRTTTEPRLGAFDRLNTTDVPEEFEPVTNWEGAVINKPVVGQEMYNDATGSLHGQLLKQGAIKLQATEGVPRHENLTMRIENSLTKNKNSPTGHITSYTGNRKRKQKSLKRQGLAEKEVEHEEVEKEEPPEEQEHKQKKKGKV